MRAFQRIPPELFYQIALHLPLTKDVLAFSLTNTLIRDALSTPALFKARLVLRGWDVSAWNDEDDTTAHWQSPGDFGRWTRIDHIFCRTAQLFDEATSEGYFLMTIILDSPVHGGVVVSGPAHPDSGSGQDDRRPDRGPFFDEEKTATWLRKLSGVLPQFVTHHRGGNISRITEARYLDVLRAYATVVDDLCTGAKVLRPDDPAPKITSSDYNWFERICFSLIALLLQCDAATIVSIFADNCEETILSQRSISSAFEDMGTEQPGTVPETLTPERITERYFAVFFFQTVLLAALHLDAAQLDVPPPLLPAPALPHFDHRSSSLYYSHPYHDNGAPVEPGAITTALSVPLRPWLHDGLASTPLAALSSTTSCAWAGYYTYKGMDDRDPPMYIELRSTPAPDARAETDTEAAHDRVYFRGEGHDEVGMFDLIGTCDTRTGVISAIKGYGIIHQWEWRGMLTPFGMAGMWGRGWGNAWAWGAGWWWIWPREWSPAMTRQHD